MALIRAILVCTRFQLCKSNWMMTMRFSRLISMLDNLKSRPYKPNGDIILKRPTISLRTLLSNILRRLSERVSLATAGTLMLHNHYGAVLHKANLAMERFVGLGAVDSRLD